MDRKSTNSARDARIFKQTSKPHKLNVRPLATRGGIRL